MFQKLDQPSPITTSCFQVLPGTALLFSVEAWGLSLQWYWLLLGKWKEMTRGRKAGSVKRMTFLGQVLGLGFGSHGCS